jgi:hypothetical protein
MRKKRKQQPKTPLSHLHCNHHHHNNIIIIFKIEGIMRSGLRYAIKFADKSQG